MTVQLFHAEYYVHVFFIEIIQIFSQFLFLAWDMFEVIHLNQDKMIFDTFESTILINLTTGGTTECLKYILRLKNMLFDQKTTFNNEGFFLIVGPSQSLRL